MLLRQKQLREDLIIAKKKIKNQKFEKERIFKKENKVYLQTKNLNMKNKIKKLKHMTESFFKIIRNIQNTAYKLNISNFRIHNVFNALLLNKIDESVFLTKTLKIKAREKDYEVREILRERKNKKRKEFLIN